MGSSLWDVVTPGRVFCHIECRPMKSSLAKPLYWLSMGPLSPWELATLVPRLKGNPVAAMSVMARLAKRGFVAPVRGDRACDPVSGRSSRRWALTALGCHAAAHVSWIKYGKS